MMRLDNPAPSRFEAVSSQLSQQGSNALFPLSTKIELLDMTLMRWEFMSDQLFVSSVHEHILVEIDFLQQGETVLSRESKFYFYTGFNAVPLTLIKPKHADAGAFRSLKPLNYRLNTRLLLKE